MKPMLIRQANGGIRSIVLAATIVALYAASCGTPQDIVDFKGYSDTPVRTNIRAAKLFIQANHLSPITVSSLNPATAGIFNTSDNTGISSAASNGNHTQVFGYLVNPGGIIQFPGLNNIYTEGLVKAGLKGNITKALADKDLLTGPVVNVSYCMAFNNFCQQPLTH